MGREILYSEVNLYYDEVMDYSYILHSAMPVVETFEAFGFEKLCKLTQRSFELVGGKKK